MRAVFHSEARLELAEAARWYNSQSRGLGSDLRRQVKAAVARIVATSATGSPVQSGKTLTRMFLKHALLIWSGIGGCP